MPSLRWLNARTPLAGQVAYEPRPPDESLERIPDAYLAFWVAVHSDGRREGIVGCGGLVAPQNEAVLMVPDYLVSKDHTVILRKMRVAPEVQRQGIGRELFQAAERWAAHNGFNKLILETGAHQEASISHFKAMGCEIAGQTIQDSIELVWMSKVLGVSTG